MKHLLFSLAFLPFGIITGKTQEISFNVSDVVPASQKLTEEKAENLYAYKLQRPITWYPESDAQEHLVYAGNNAFIETIHTCFDEHRPLVLSPDAIWLLICQGVSRHINGHIDSLEQVLFIQDKPQEIRFRNDSLASGGVQWQSLLDLLSDETTLYTRTNVHPFFVPHFSTTTPNIETAYQITLLEAYKKIFRYVGETGCGIPKITLKGNRDDWQKIRNQLDTLHVFGLQKWGDELKPILDEFIACYDGKPNTTFWQGIYKNYSAYGAFHISGWIIKFFPYLIVEDGAGIWDKDGSYAMQDLTFTGNPFLYGNTHLQSTIGTDNLPSGISDIKIHWENYFTGEFKTMQVNAGFFAMRQYPDLSLEPFISWSISDSSQPYREMEINMPEWTRTEHTNDFWSPYVYEPGELKSSAVYNPDEFSSQTQSILSLKDALEKALLNPGKWKREDLVNFRFQFVVLTDGKLTDFTLPEENFQPGLQAFIQNWFAQLPESWKPATMEIANVIESDADSKNTNSMPVNSRVTLLLFPE